jgi:choline/glycine/proline betaine transport protein
MAEGGTAEAAKEAMKFTFLHWVFMLGSVCIGRFIFGLLHVFSRTPLTIRSIFILLGDKIYGRIGDAIDILLFLLLYLVWLLL